GGAVEGLASDIAQSSDSLASSAGSAGRGIQSGLVSGMTGMQSKFRAIWNEIKNITGETLSSMTDNVRTSMAEMTELVGQLGSQINSLGGSISRLGETLDSDFLKGLGNGISKVGSVVNDVMNVVQKISSLGDTFSKLTNGVQNFSSSLSDGGLLSKLGDL